MYIKKNEIYNIIESKHFIFSNFCDETSFQLCMILAICNLFTASSIFLFYTGHTSLYPESGSLDRSRHPHEKIKSNQIKLMPMMIFSVYLKNEIYNIIGSKHFICDETSFQLCMLLAICNLFTASSSSIRVIPRFTQKVVH